MSVTRPQSGQPFYFGPADKQLFGCYHESSAGAQRSCAVVICQPMGHEYIYCHRALRQLAIRLSESGFPVLRFDFYGCGDSAGNAQDATVAQWLLDLSNAIGEVRMRTKVAHVCLMGIRLGAALSFVATSERGDIDSIVLWDPVVIGNTYLQDLNAIQEKASEHRRKSVTRPSGNLEICGFPLPKTVRAELEQMNLLKISPVPRTNILSIQSDTAGETPNLKAHLIAHNTRSEHQEISAPKIWEPTVEGNLLVPNQILRSIVSWASRTQA